MLFLILLFILAFSSLFLFMGIGVLIQTYKNFTSLRYKSYEDGFTGMGFTFLLLLLAIAGIYLGYLLYIGVMPLSK